MFTGIVEEVGRVESISPNNLTVNAAKITRCMSLGDSIDVNGICLTVSSFDRRSFSVDIMQETYSRTALRYLQSGSPVNLESAATLQKPLGGHLVQGHVDDVGEIEAVNHHDDTVLISIVAPLKVMRYIVEKGFIAVDGISLTVVGRDREGFTVSIVKYTWENTRLSSLQPGDRVNLEADIIAKYVEQFMGTTKENISLEFLKDHGFLS
jgi:riboflavin synthase